MDLALRRGTPEDVPSMCGLHTATVTKMASAHYSPEIIEAWTSAFSPDKVIQAIEAKEVFDLMATYEGRLVGFGFMQGNQVRAIYVHPDFSGLGVASTLMAAFEEKAREDGQRNLELESSLNAEGFYIRLGFRPLGIGTFTLPQGKMMGSINMCKDLD